MTRTYSKPLQFLLDSEWAQCLTVVDFSKENELERICKPHGVGYVQWSSWSRFEQELSEIDLLISYKLPYIIPREVIAKARYGGVNIHPSLLPKYPGLNPWLAMYYDMELNGGVTIHRLSGKPDSGNILLQESFQIEPGEPLSSAIAKSESVATGLLQKFLTDNIYTCIGKPQSLPMRQKNISFDDARKLPVYRLWHLLRGLPMLINEIFAELPIRTYEVREYLATPTDYSDARVIFNSDTQPIIACRDGYIPLHKQHLR